MLESILQSPNSFNILTFNPAKCLSWPTLVLILYIFLWSIMFTALHFDRNCIVFSFVLPDIKGSSEFSTGDTDTAGSRIFQRTETYAGFTFLVHHSIIIRSLNILRHFVTAADCFVQVNLMNSITREKIVSATFLNDGSDSGSDLLEKAVEPYILPKGFEGQVIIELIGSKSGKISLNHSQCWLQWNNASGLITFLQLIRNKNEKPVPFHYMSCTYACLTFILHGMLLWMLFKILFTDLIQLHFIISNLYL